jgi:hypothetical protein
LPAKSIFINYIVRIYRFQKNNPRSLVGIVEETGVKGRKAFTGYDELWEILNTNQGVKPPCEKGKKVD